MSQFCKSLCLEVKEVTDTVPLGNRGVVHGLGLEPHAKGLVRDTTTRDIGASIAPTDNHNCRHPHACMHQCMGAVVCRLYRHMYTYLHPFPPHTHPHIYTHACTSTHAKSHTHHAYYRIWSEKPSCSVCFVPFSPGPPLDLSRSSRPVTIVWYPPESRSTL